jgi:phenylalanyl-tRNA synthetase alpha subunit
MDPCDLSPPTTHWQTLVGEGQENMPPIAADSIAVDVARSDVRKRRAAPMELERQECKRFRRTLGVLRALDASTPGSSTLPSTPADLKSLSTEIRAEMQASVAELKREMAEQKKIFKKEFTDLKKEVKKETADLKKDMKKETADLKKDMKKETTELKTDMEEVKICIDALHNHVQVAAQDIQAIKTAMGRMADSLAPMSS